MTPETRAAAERVRRFVAVEQAEGATTDTPVIDGIDTFTLGDLMLLLAALEPAGITTTDHPLTETESEHLKHPWITVQRDQNGRITGEATMPLTYSSGCHIELTQIDVDNRAATFTPHEPPTPIRFETPEQPTKDTP